LAIIEETEHDMGTGMDNIKIELKGNHILYHKALIPTPPTITIAPTLFPIKKVE
jgi:hypothetical protein